MLILSLSMTFCLFYIQFLNSLNFLLSEILKLNFVVIEILNWCFVYSIITGWLNVKFQEQFSVEIEYLVIADTVTIVCL